MALLGDLWTKLTDPKNEMGRQALMTLSQGLMAAGAPQPFGQTRLGAMQPYLAQLGQLPQQMQMQQIQKMQMEQQRANLERDRAQKTAMSRVFGGHDPSSGIAWNQGRPGLLNAEGMPSPEGMGVLGQAFPEEYAKQSMGLLFAKPGADQKPVEWKTVEIFDEQTGQPRVVQFNPVTGEQRPMGGMKAATPPTQRYTPQGPMTNDQGEVVGEAMFDQATGKRFLRDIKTGQDVPMPAGLTPVTETALSKDMMSGQQFTELQKEAQRERASVAALQRYWKTVKDSPAGWRALAEQFLAKARTVFGGELTPEQFASLQQRGNLQALIGRFRLETVGGGVMTEQDALRVIERLGGDLSATRNKEVVAELLRSLMKEKLATYNDVIVPTINRQRNYPGRKGIPKLDPIEMPEDAFSTGAQTADEIADDLLGGAR